MVHNEIDKDSKVHKAVDTLGHLLALPATAANKQKRTEQVQEITGDTARVAFADEGYTGAIAGQMAADHRITFIVVKRPKATKGFVLLHKRWVVERSFAWTGPSGRVFVVWSVTTRDALIRWRVSIS